ncbi:MAG: Asp-tRNA(Asn)/Glu-tRNA(Gln) amidotransferase subunit GatA [Lachnospiraceae bacterium]|nr:Asp-tRNA(Asn)/Glu-tRNA(Gln) amidotransferase subunit GatA [Lachnospiraceae bacterium]
MQIEQMGATALSRELKKGTVSVAEAVAHYQKQIEEKDGELQAFLTLTGEDLQRQIDKVQEGIRNGRYTGPLAGVPVAVKDNICTKGLRTTCASKMLENFVPSYDATVVKRLQDAGMLVLGKTNMDEFAMGSTSETSSFQITKNPWNPACVPGGSSGGSAVAVAAGMAPLALGSDTGGSIRQPAAFCGVVGLLPTYGRVSRYGLVAYASSLDQIGPMGRTVADCKALYEAIAGFDEKDGTSVRRGIRNSEECEDSALGRAKEGLSADVLRENSVARLKGMRIGIPKEYMQSEMNPEVREAVKKVAVLLEQQGAIVEEMSLPLTEYAVATYYLVACAEASSNLSRFDGVKYGYRVDGEQGLHEMYKKSRTEGLGEETKRRILLGSFVLSEGYYDAYYLKALKVKRLIKEEYENAFKTCDCLLTPVAPGTASKLGTSLQNPLQMYLGDVDTVAVNLAGLPALSVPCGLDKQGLPIGVQFIGNAFCEETLFTVGEAYEALRGAFPMPGEQTAGNGKEGV